MTLFVLTRWSKVQRTFLALDPTKPQPTKSFCTRIAIVIDSILLTLVYFATR